MNLGLDAVKMRYVLIALLVLVLGGMAVGNYFAGQFLRQAVTETTHDRIDVETSSQQVAQLQKLEAKLDELSVEIIRSEQIAVDTQEYQYQNQIIKDINAYAARTGITVTGYSFSESGSDSGGGTATPAPTTGTDGAASPGTTTPSTGGGPKTMTASINMSSEVPYTNYLRFLKAIEGNLTKMQVTGINLAPSGENPDILTNPTVQVLVYVRQ